MIFRIFILMEYFVFQNGYETQDNAENFGSSPIHRNFYNKKQISKIGLYNTIKTYQIRTTKEIFHPIL